MELTKATDRKKLFSKSLAGLAVAGGVSTLTLMREQIHRRHVYLPAKFPNGVWDPSPFGLNVEDVWFEAEDGIGLHGWWIPHRRARGTLLFCHGNSGSIAHHIGVLKLLARLRVNIFAFDYRGYGRSEGRPAERGLYRDARAAWDVLVHRMGISPDEIIYFGHSLGGAVAIDTALRRPAAGLIVQSTFTDLSDASRAVLPVPGVGWVTKNQFRSIEKVPELRLPKLFIHGTEDGTIPVTLGRRLYEAAEEPKQMLEIPRAGHNDVHRHGGLRYLRTVSSFRKRTLKRAGE